MLRFVIVVCLAVAGLVGGVAALAGERPVVSAFSFSPTSFRVVSSRAHGGATVRFRLSAPATVRITIARRLAGRVSRHHGCVKPTPGVAGRRACTRYAPVGTLVLARQKAGRHTLAFRGRIGNRALAPGSYRATLVTVDSDHHRSGQRTAGFTVLRTPAGASPSPTPALGSNPVAAPSPTVSPSPTGTPPPPSGDQFPNERTTGVPAGWTPARTRSTDMDVNTEGAVVQDLLLTDGAKLNINAPNVIVRRVKLEGGWIDTASPGVLIEDTTIDRGGPETNGGEGVVSYCGYTARRVAIIDRSEGFRESGCEASNPTRIEDSFARITEPADCTDWHGDGIQGYYGTNLTVANVTIDFHESDACSGTSPFFYNGGPGGSPNGRVDVNRLLLKGGGYSFRMGTPGSVRGLKIVDGSWRYDAILMTDAGCAGAKPWEAKIVTVDSNWKITKTVADQPCFDG